MAIIEIHIFSSGCLWLSSGLEILQDYKAFPPRHVGELVLRYGLGIDIHQHCLRQVSGMNLRTCRSFRHSVLEGMCFPFWGCTRCALLKRQGQYQAALSILYHDFPFQKCKRTLRFFCPVSVCYSRRSSFQVAFSPRDPVVLLATCLQWAPHQVLMYWHIAGPHGCKF